MQKTQQIVRRKSHFWSDEHPFCGGEDVQTANAQSLRLFIQSPLNMKDSRTRKQSAASRGSAWILQTGRCRQRLCCRGRGIAYRKCWCYNLECNTSVCMCVAILKTGQLLHCFCNRCEFTTCCGHVRPTLAVTFCLILWVCFLQECAVLAAHRKPPVLARQKGGAFVPKVTRSLDRKRTGFF